MLMREILSPDCQPELVRPTTIGPQRRHLLGDAGIQQELLATLALALSAWALTRSGSGATRAVATRA
jgi:hypothetical protein